MEICDKSGDMVSLPQHVCDRFEVLRTSLDDSLYEQQSCAIECPNTPVSTWRKAISFFDAEDTSAFCKSLTMDEIMELLWLTHQYDCKDMYRMVCIEMVNRTHDRSEKESAQNIREEVFPNGHSQTK
jgi:hypothetical protein